MKNTSRLEEVLVQELKSVRLSSAEKERLKGRMLTALSKRESSLAERFAVGLKEFWNSTYEISVAPIAACLSIAALLTAFAVQPQLGHPNTPRSYSEMVYLQSVIEDDSGQRVVFTPVFTEVNKNENY